MTSLHRFLLLLLLAMCVGCSSPDDPPAVDMGDVGGTADIGKDVSPDEGAPDVGADVDPGPTACELQGDCEVDELCVEGTCVAATSCDDVNDWRRCVQDFEPFGAEVMLRAMCGVHGYCRVACLEDGECGAGQTCTDYGYCRDFDADLTGADPGGAPRAPLQAGVSNVLMTFPIGISMAGYGSRFRSGSERYAELLSSSVGQFHAQFARGLALDNGERQLLIVRLPIIFASAWLHEAVARRLEDATGANWRDSLVISTTHSHSGPARYWPIVDDTALDLGRLGSDSYHHTVFEWMVESTVDAALQALDDLQPAQFGWTIVEAYDTDDAIASDRWSQTPPFDDNRLLLLRVDDADGQPLAAAISLGMHSTFNESDYLTGDAAGALERQLELELGRRYDRFVPVMFLSENSGTMAPRGDKKGHQSLHQHEYLGFEFTRRAIDAFNSMPTTDDLDIEARTHIFPISYRRVGYELGEWARGNAGTYESTFFHGAIQCLANTDNDPATHAEPFDYFCLPIHFLSQNRPATLFRRSMITALRLNGLTVVTLPGESSMEVGWQVLREARDRLGVDPAAAFVWGYAQDHQLYITPTNLRGELPSFPGISTPMAPDDYPDYAFSFLQGGYEPSLSVWGHLFGDFVVERAVEALTLLDQPDLAVDTALPAQYTPFSTAAFDIEPSPPDAVGTVVDQMPTSVPRLTPVEFAWVGGDPGVEMPQAPLVALERADGGGFAPLTRVNYRPYDNREPVLITRVRRNADRWEWAVYWEETKDFPAGDYRFRVLGHHQVDGVRTPYEVTSDTFALVGAPIDTAANLSGSTLTGTLAYPAAPAFNVVGGDTDPGRVVGSFRMRHPDVPTGVADPVIAEDVTTLTVRVLDAGQQQIAEFTLSDVAVQTSATGVPRTTFSVDIGNQPAGSTVQIDVADRWGNVGAHP